ncbi:MAG: twin-arginine translocation signal domain-containing protein [Candidatus Acidoferrales bacterium]|nr:twin-arginine translocation signal domain-containing protein [Candidatus Acidoferrales bacterium]
MLTRRDFIAELAFAGAAMAPIAMLPEGILAPGQMGARAAVVSIHMEQPYIDATGRALPYLPPDGLCAGAPVAHLSETEFRRRFVYL